MPLNTPDAYEDRVDELEASEMPRGMAPKPRQGDLEEAFLLVLPDIDVASKMPRGIGDAAMIDELQRDAQQTETRMERAAGRTAAGVDDLPDAPNPDPDPVIRVPDFRSDFEFEMTMEEI